MAGWQAPTPFSERHGARIPSFIISCVNVIAFIQSMQSIGHQPDDIALILSEQTLECQILMITTRCDIRHSASGPQPSLRAMYERQRPRVP
ncbi:hypothetical protein AUP44_26725 [Tistrella mobilis]|uniref:Uncharacterized protein n=1 Tax=Tistrella mobilis TaxID=171437 RepID=A0A162L7W3_9PROT|nr:hypothetical protein AUP44_26725 [Tistrella mobilis]